MFATAMNFDRIHTIVMVVVVVVVVVIGKKTPVNHS
jgi:hypothetical protein